MWKGTTASSFVCMRTPCRKLKQLSERVGCSIGLVSKVMTYLKENAWVESSPKGYIILESESF